MNLTEIQTNVILELQKATRVFITREFYCKTEEGKIDFVKSDAICILDQLGFVHLTYDYFKNRQIFCLTEKGHAFGK